MFEPSENIPKIMKLAQFQIPGGSFPAPSGIPSGNLNETGGPIFQVGIDLLFYLASFLAVVFIVVSGIQWITSGGDPVKIAAARRKLLYSIIGFLIVVGAFLILNILSGILGKNPLTQ